MKIDITKEKENPLLKRKEISVKIDHPEEATPSKAALQQLVAKQLNVEIEKTDVRYIFSGTGTASSRAAVFLWNEKKVEDLSKIKKEKKTEEKKETKKDETSDEKKVIEEKKAPKEEKPIEGEKK